MIALVFPGQGSQSVGMLADLAARFPVVEATFATVSEACGRDLWRMAQDGPAEVLGQTANTQPALLAAGVATWRAWQASGGAAPVAVAGHSLGEYCALVAAGVLSLEDAARIVAVRGQAMQEAVPAGEGAMAAILKLEDDVVAQVCADAAEGEVVEPVNFNAPGQVVVAGAAGAVARAVEGAKAARGRAIPLDVSVPSHSALMRPAAEPLAEALAGATFSAPGIPVLHGADAAQHVAADEIRSVLAEQIYRPVQWVRTVTGLQGLGATAIGECGPGKVLTGLIKRIDRSIDGRAIAEPGAMADAVEAWGETA
ncbi:MAG: ACP S-malonyltransferase [Pseudomonadota bacterium]